MRMDDTIEMIDLDGVSPATMEISFDELSSPNQALGEDLQMVLKETRVIDSDDISAALKKNMDSLINPVSPDDTIVFNPTAIENEAERINNDKEMSLNDTDEEESEEYEEENEVTAEEESEEYEENDYEFDDNPDDDSEEEMTENSEDDTEDSEEEVEDEEDFEEETEDSEDEEDFEEDEESEDDYDEEEDEEEPVVKPVRNKAKAGFVPPSVAKKNAAKKKKAERKNVGGKSRKQEAKADGKKNQKSSAKADGRKAQKPDVKASGKKVQKSNVKSAGKKGGKIEAQNADKKGFSAFISKLGALEYASIIIALVIISLLVALGIRVLNTNKRKAQIEQFASVGYLLENMDGIGQRGVEAMALKAEIEGIRKEEPEEKKPDEETEEKPEQKETLPVTVNFSSVEKDLKIKFVDKNTKKLITGVKFEITAKGPDGKTYNWNDSDRDGIIYETGLVAGNYEVKIKSVDNYEFPDTASIVKVQGSIVYQAINIMDEVYDMDDVDLPNDESIGKDITTGDILEDTVPWVESTKTLVSGSDGYKEIPRSSVSNPFASQSASNGNFWKADTEILKIGETKVITLPDNMKHEGQNPSYRWNINEGLAIDGADNGTSVTIRGVSFKENAMVSCTIFFYPTPDATEPATDTYNYPNVIRVEDGSGAVLPTGIVITGSDSVTIGNTVTLSATVTPENANDRSVTWTSGNGDIATVDGNGTVTPHKEGSVEIKATCNGNPAVTASKTIKVVSVPADISLSVKDKAGNKLKNGAKIVMIQGTEHQLAIKASESAGGYNTASSVPSAATVSENGLIKAVAKGSTEIVVQSNGKDASGNSVSVKINVEVIDNGNLTYEGKEIYIKNSAGNYQIARYSDYENYEVFYVQSGAEYKYTGWNTVDGKTKYFTADGKYVTGEQIIGGVRYFFGPDGTLGISRGIDVSKYQGTIDWNAVKNSGISFVIIRVGFRGYGTGKLVKDDRYESYVKGATAAGLKVGLYVYSQAVNETEAVEEASLCVNMAQGRSISYPIFIDTERTDKGNGRADNLSKDQRTAVCRAFCETVKSSGYTPGVYSNKDWLINKMDVSRLNSYKIWLAHYCTATDYTGKYDLWQHSKKGKISGISGDVDLDISYLGY